MDYSPLLMSFIALLIVFTCVNQAIKKEKFNKTLFFFCFFCFDFNPHHILSQVCQYF